MKICIPYIIYTLSDDVITQRLISCLIYTCRTTDRKPEKVRYYVIYISDISTSLFTLTNSYITPQYIYYFNPLSLFNLSILQIGIFLD